MSLKDILGGAMKVAIDTTFTVIIDGISEIMTYFELGLYLVNNSNEIERIEVILK